MKKIRLKTILLSLLYIFFLRCSSAPVKIEEITPEDEKAMSQEYLPQILEDYPPVRDNELQVYISELGKGLVKAMGVENRSYSYEFIVVGTENVNLFSLPSGSIFITKPLLTMVQTEAELVFLISHEIAHGQRRDVSRRIFDKHSNMSILTKLGTSVGTVFSGKVKMVAYSACKKTQPYSPCKKLGKSLNQPVTVDGNRYGEIKAKHDYIVNSPEDELYADKLAVELFAKTTYKKEYAGNFFKRLYEIRLQAMKDGKKEFPQT